LEREKEVVLQELAEARDTPSDLIFDELWSAAFPEQPLGRSILGSEPSIASIKVGDLEAWQSERYRAGNLVLAAAGRVDHGELVGLAERHLGALPAGRAQAHDAASFGGAIRIARMPSEQAHLSFAYAAPAELDDRYLAARLFADVVGGGASSRLFQEVREERGIAYSVGAGMHPYSDIGLFFVHAATSPREAAAAGQLIEEVLSAAAGEITQRELDRVRTRACAGLLMHLETPWGQASYAARQLAVHGRLVEPGEVVEKLAAVTLDEVREAGAKMLAGERASATIGVPAARAA
jgi:predicted Zn-dependent peptidase